MVMECHKRNMKENLGDEKQSQGKLAQQQSPKPSPSTSPTHEFSFTISLHHQQQPPNTTNAPPTTAVDLSPAGEIFFNGHLLPLHHLPNPPQSTTTPTNNNITEENVPMETSSNFISNSKSKSFSLKFGPSRWRRGFEELISHDEKEEEKEKTKRKLIGFTNNVSLVLKRYVRMVVVPLFSFRERKEKVKLGRPTNYSFSGFSSANGKQELRGVRRWEMSAPASMRASPARGVNSSTMDELQAAIQAAIVHCKNSVSMETKIRS